MDPRRSWAGVAPCLAWPLSYRSLGGRGAGVAGVRLAVCWVCAGLGQLEAAEELVRFGSKCCITWDDFWASGKHSAKALHSWSKQAAWRDWSVEEGNLVHLFHLHHCEPEVAFQHYQAGHWSLMAWVVALVARRARSIGLLRSLSEAASRPASSLASILAWKT